jgi:hypothetical protein
VSALAVVVADSGNGQLLMVATMPIGLFAFLDAYYLGLERRFRACYETFVKKLHMDTAKIDDAFLVAPKLKVRGLFKEAGLALFSFSVWPFYVGLAAILWMMRNRLIHGG